MDQNLVTWLQIPADDVEGVWEFYGRVFGWSPETAYANEPRPGAIYGEIVPRGEDLREPRPVIRVSDIDGTLAQVEAAGGAVIAGAGGDTRDRDGFRGVRRSGGKPDQRRRRRLSGVGHGMA